MENNCKCPICTGPSTAFYNSNTKGAAYNCQVCGKFYLTKKALDTLKENIKMISAVFYYLTIVNSITDELTIFTDDDELDTMTNYKKNLTEIEKLYPTTFSERLDKVMQLINLKVKNTGDHFILREISFSEYHEIDISRFSMLPSSNLDSEPAGFFQILLDLNLIKRSSSMNFFTFTYEGWKKIDSIQQSNNSSTAFIAMSFDTKDPTVSKARKAIFSAIRRANYDPVITDEKPYNTPIPEEIYYEIKHAAFVVAELIQQNNGAYYEAGLATGSGKDVIFTCYKGDADKIHFDTSHMNTIIWENEPELSEQLFKRIKYTIGLYNNQEQKEV